MSKPVIRLDYLEMMAGGEAETRRELMDMLMADLQSYPARMIKSYQAGQWPELHRLSHYLKTTLPYAGNDRLTETNRRLERILKEEEEYSEVPQLLKQIQALSLEVLQALEAERKARGG